MTDACRVLDWAIAAEAFSVSVIALTFAALAIGWGIREFWS